MDAEREYLPTEATVKIETSLTGLDWDMDSIASGRKKMNRRRFSDEQIKKLEFKFESESRPESQLKHQLANDLGLQPRQVAIWFQNRRARSKTKQIERDYSTLKASYDTLASSIESLKKENQSLLLQLQKMKNLQGQATGSRNRGLGEAQQSNSNDVESKYGDTMSESEEKPCPQLEGYNHNIDESTRDDNSRNVECTGEETEILNMAGTTDGSLTSSSCFLDESISCSQWWEFWS